MGKQQVAEAQTLKSLLVKMISIEKISDTLLEQLASRLMLQLLTVLLEYINHFL